MKDLEKLQEFEKTRSKSRFPSDIKPCIAHLLDNNPEIRKADNAFIASIELHRVGKSDSQIKSKLTKLGIKESRVKGIIKSLSKEVYQNSCPGLLTKGFCLYESRFDCWWYDRIARQSQKEWRERDFWRSKYPDQLGAARSMLYLAIKEIEKIRGYKAGSRLYVSWDELQRVSGVNRHTIKPGLEGLDTIGLITYKPGHKRAKGSKGLASEISRVIPIPKMP